uniref:Uncharacterized protein n=1 Tax=Timema bartmani TaxID=61472 RepID=A0A7R9FEG9_9NEOP|nr:unnamed protein product [Timema bartmani]
MTKVLKLALQLMGNLNLKCFGGKLLFHVEAHFIIVLPVSEDYKHGYDLGSLKVKEQEPNTITSSSDETLGIISNIVLQSGDWVVVCYDKLLYPGEVVSVNTNICKVQGNPDHYSCVGCYGIVKFSQGQSIPMGTRHCMEHSGSLV